MVFGAGGKYPEAVPPILLYGVALTRVHQFKYLGHVLTAGLKDDDDIERERRALSYNNAFRVLMGLPRFCSASGMFAEMHVDCFYTIMRKKCASLVRRVRASSNGILVADRLDCCIVNRCSRISAGIL
nr:uncharacterized protein LOC126054555 [Helicoverpa armigera]